MKTKKNIAANGSNKSEKKGAESCANISPQRMPKELEIHVDESCEKIKVDEEAERVLRNSIADWVDVGTYLEIIDLMKGLEPKLAFKVAHYIGDFCWGIGRTVTGIDVIDYHLLSIYQHIYKQAKACGKKLEMSCPF